MGITMSVKCDSLHPVEISQKLNPWLLSECIYVIKNINFHQHPFYKWSICLFHHSVLLSDDKSSESKVFHLILISSLLQSAEKDAAISRGDLLFLIMFSNDLLAWAILRRNICLTLIFFSNLTSSLEPKCSSHVVATSRGGRWGSQTVMHENH